MNKLIIHHLYAQSAFDLSNNRNHGKPTAVFKALAPNAPGFTFAQPDSEVIVAANPTLQNLWSIRAIVTFNLAIQPPVTRRYNLMEGHLSFSLFVEQDGSLAGTIVDSSGHWKGVNSVPNLVQPNKWHTAELQHDGINKIRLILDGAEVAAAYNVTGTVRSVGSHGVAIGHWPEAPGTYTFLGFIREAFLYKYDPHTDINNLLDPCCIDRKAIQQFVDRLKERGETSDSVNSKAWEILKFAADAQTAVRNGNKTVSDKVQRLNDMAMAAYIRGDQATYTSITAQVAYIARKQLDEEELKALKAREDRIIKDLPFDLKELEGLLKAMCLDKPSVDPKQFEKELEHLRK